jgi:hypothetical protein
LVCARDADWFALRRWRVAAARLALALRCDCVRLSVVRVERRWLDEVERRVVPVLAVDRRVVVRRVLLRVC